MRLDEWQKYIDSQFLDEEAEPVPPPQAAKVVVEVAKPEEPPKAAGDAETITQEALFTAVFSEEPVPATPSHSDTAPVTVQNTVTMVVAPPSSPVLPPAGRAPRIELLTPLPETTPEPKPVLSATEEITNRTRRRSQNADSSLVSSSDTTSAPPALSDNLSSALSQSETRAVQPANESSSAAPSASSWDAGTPTLGLFEPISDLDADIPAFQQYLPSSHAAAAPSEAPALNGLQTQPLFMLEAAETQEDSAHHHVSPVEIEPDNTTDNNTLEHDDLSADASIERVRRTPKSRARHARNVRPENVPSGLSAAELWAAVPRHVQTLLALERLEEKEVAQFSYKRQFQEKRHELIERLLDPILSLEDTARLLNVCPTTVRRYTNKGILTYYRKEPERSLRNGGETAVVKEVVNEKETRQRRFRLSDILAFLETQQSAIDADRQAEHQAERRRLARAANIMASLPLESDMATDALHAGKDS